MKSIVLDSGEKQHSGKNAFIKILRNTVRNTALAMAMAATAGCGFKTISANESAVQITNGQITQPRVSPGRHLYFWIHLPPNNIQYYVIPTTTQTLPLTVTDTSNCQSDCIPSNALYTADKQVVSGSLTLQYRIKDNANNALSAAAILWRERGVTDIDDMNEKLIGPAFRDCTIHVVNSTNSVDLINNGRQVVANIKSCLQREVDRYNLGVEIEEVFSNGFGPAPEARPLMTKYADARMQYYTALVQAQTARVREEAAVKNADVIGAEYRELEREGVPGYLIPEMYCLDDVNSRNRPCVPGTATATTPNIPTVQAPAVSAQTTPGSNQ